MYKILAIQIQTVLAISCTTACLLFSVAFAQTTPSSSDTATGTPPEKVSGVPCETLFKDDPKAIKACNDIRKDSPDTNDSNAILQGMVDARDSIYGCNGIAKYGPVGLSKTPAGAYVPVSEDAVALNTFILVNKVCVLDAVARNNRNAFVTALVKAQVKAINEGGADGRPQYPQDPRGDIADISDKVVADLLTQGDFGGVCPAYNTAVKRSLARNWSYATQVPQGQLFCSFPAGAAVQQAFLGGQFSSAGFAGLWALADPANTPDGAYFLGQDYISDVVANAREDYYKDLQYGNGFFSKKSCEDVPVGNGKFETQCFTVTPGSVIAQSASYLALTGNRMAESADEINKMVGTLFGNLASQVLASNTGFSGATTSQGGQMSYLDQAVNTAYQSAQTQTLTTGVEALQKALTIETAYVATRTNSKKSLETATDQVRNLEKTCMATLSAQAKVDIKKQVQDEECAKQSTDTTSLNPSCSVAVNVTETTVEGATVLDARGPTVRKVVAIKTPGKADGIVRSTIQPMLDIVQGSLNSSQKGLTLLNQLGSQVQNATSPDVVAYVISNLNQLITAKLLHDDTSLAAAKDQHGKIVDTMQSLVDRTKEQWEGDWCQASKWQGLIVPTPASYK